MEAPYSRHSATLDRHFPKRRLLLLLPLVLTVVLYGYSITLPFFLDDGVLLGIIRDDPPGTRGLRFWEGTPPSRFYFSYYRPLVFSIWEWQHAALDGRFDPVTLHALNVFVYGVAGCGVAALTHRLTRWVSAGVIAGLVFVAFPFNYNAVIWVASLFHLLMVMGMVLAVYFGLLAVHGRRPRVMVGLVALCTFIAVFSHENGILIPPLLGLLLVVVEGWRVIRQRVTWLTLGAASIPVAAYLYLVQTLPKVNPDVNFGPKNAVENFGYFLEGLVYPVVALVYRQTHFEAKTEHFYGLAAITLVPLLVYGWFRSRRMFLIALFGLAWFVLASLPTIFFLEPTYLVGSWRLLMVTVPGAAILWGTLLACLWRRWPLPIRGQKVTIAIGRLIVFLLGAWGMYVSVDFLMQRRGEAVVQADYMQALQAEIDEHAVGERPLLINAPTFLAAPDARHFFPSPGMGVIYVAGYANFNLMYEAETNKPYPYVNALLFRDTFRPPSRFSYAPFETFPFGVDFTGEVRQASDIFVTVFKGRDFYPQYVGSPGTATDNEAMAVFAEAGVTLLDGYGVYTAPDLLTFFAQWRVDGEEPQHVVPKITVLCDGVEVGGAIGSIWGGIHPFRVWLVGESQAEQREIGLSGSVTRDCLTIEVGVVGEVDHSQIFRPQGIEADSVSVPLR